MVCPMKSVSSYCIPRIILIQYFAASLLIGATSLSVVVSIVQIFATGQGLTSPPGIAGEITGLPLRKPILPVGVQIGGMRK
jgi:uncharacterized protein (TIGR03437 family)